LSDAAIILRDLACVRGGRMLFAGVNLSLTAGGSAQIAGPNGIGKSSLLRIIAGLLRQYAGTVQCVGAVALTDELDALDRDRTVHDALSFWARVDEVPTARIDAALDDLAITHLRDIPVRMLSTGQRKRAALARTIMTDAPIWLLDEPANGLDVASAETLGRIVERHRAQGGIVLAASHMPLAWSQDEIVELHAPKIHADEDDA
jgi:heme exporter protein A